MQAKTGKICWDTSNLTIINPNRTFCSHFKRVDDYLKNQCYEQGISIENDCTLIEVRKVRIASSRTTMWLSSDTTQDRSSKSHTASSTR